MKYIPALLAGLLLLPACQSTPSTTIVASPPQTPLEQELERTEQNATQSARNALDQARLLYFPLSPRLANVGVDVAAYQELKQNVLPSFIAVANALSSQSDLQIKADFQELYSDVVTQILNGINNNLQLYQGSFELPQVPGSINLSQALEELSRLFQATEYSEQFIAELSQFNQVLNQSEFNSILQGIQNQQVVVINGILRFSNQTEDTDALKNAYQTLVQSLTSPNLFSQLRQIAIKAYGEDKVAYTLEQLTPTQSNPNQLVMVVQEDDSTYRFIRLENGQLTNQVSIDTRGLSAADLLNNSQVVVIQDPAN